MHCALAGESLDLRRGRQHPGLRRSVTACRGGARRADLPVAVLRVSAINSMQLGQRTGAVSIWTDVSYKIETKATIAKQHGFIAPLDFDAVATSLDPVSRAVHGR